jgi:NTE family protein
VNAPPAHADIARRARHTRESKRRENIDLALCLSGGGFRAALFHLGALRRLFELGVLQQVDTIAAVSGGSILAAHLAERIRDWETLQVISVDERSAWWEAEVARPFREFTSKDIRTRSIARRLLPWNWPRVSASVEGLEAALRSLTDMKIEELPDWPTFIFCATDLATGELWESKKPRKNPLGVTSDSEAPLDWPVARAVAASSSFPP